MSSREKQVAAGGFLLLVALVLVQFVIRPTNAKIERARTQVADSDKALQELRLLSADCLRLKGDLEKVHERVARRKPDAEPLSLLETMEKDCGLTRANVRSMTPEPPIPVEGYAQTRITIRLESISEDQMKKLVNRIQSAELPMGVRSLDLKTSRKAAPLLDAVIEVVSVTPAAKN
jgi:hypothetical protein